MYECIQHIVTFILLKFTFSFGKSGRQISILFYAIESFAFEGYSVTKIMIYLILKLKSNNYITLLHVFSSEAIGYKSAVK